MVELKRLIILKLKILKTIELKLLMMLEFKMLKMSEVNMLVLTEQEERGFSVLNGLPEQLHLKTAYFQSICCFQ